LTTTPHCVGHKQFVVVVVLLWFCGFVVVCCSLSSPRVGERVCVLSPVLLCFSLFAFRFSRSHRLSCAAFSSLFVLSFVRCWSSHNNEKQKTTGKWPTRLTNVCLHNNNKALTRQGPDTHFQSYRTAPRLRRALVQWSLTLPVYCCVHHAATTGITQHNDTTQQTARREKQASR